MFITLVMVVVVQEEQTDGERKRRKSRDKDVVKSVICILTFYTERRMREDLAELYIRCFNEL